MSTTLVFTATYNESDSITELLTEINASLPNAHVLVVDDSSPDGTSDILRELQSRYQGLRVIRRPRKLGIGSAHQIAMQYALLHGYDRLITMDADLSHHPRYLPMIEEKLEEYDFVIGSRYAKDGSCEYRGFRLLLSRFANILVQVFLGVGLSESTTSLRGFRRELLSRIENASLRPGGYAFFFESVFRVSKNTKRIFELPIHFHDRRFGKTNLSKIEIVRAAFIFAKLIVSRVFNRKDPVTDTLAKSQAPCQICTREFFVRKYPARQRTTQEARFNCTTSAHRSHGEIRQCLCCGMTSSYPLPTTEELASFYSDVEDSLYLKNISARHATFRRNWREVQRFVPEHGSLLEVGSYCGAFLDVAAESGQRVKGLEPSRWAVEYCKNKTAHDVKHGTIADLQQSNETFDSIVAWDVVEHLADPLTDFRTINHSLKLGGKFVFSTLNIDNWFPRIMRERWPWYIDMHLYYFNHKTIEDLLNSAHFRVVFIRPYCHIITARYLLQKLEALGLRGISRAGALLPDGLLDRMLIPFRFGDIMLVCATKIGEANA